MSARRLGRRKLFNDVGVVTGWVKIHAAATRNLAIASGDHVMPGWVLDTKVTAANANGVFVAQRPRLIVAVVCFIFAW